MEFELGSLWKLVKRRLWFITALAVAAVGLAWYVSYYVLKPEYESTASFLIQGDKPSQAMGDIVAGQKLATTYGEIIRSKRIAEAVVSRLALDSTPEKLLEQVETRTSSESLVTTVVVTDSDPQRAADIANGFAEAFNANIRSIMGVENIMALDPAKVPSTPIPVTPKPLFNMTVAFGLALMAGISISMLREMADKRVSSVKDIELDLQLPLLGTLGKLKPRKKRTATKATAKPTDEAEGAKKDEENNASAILPGPPEIN
ncbi:YveK family protein [Paenibacillus koleovorans]|uniref:YveK family protein n=1 Tax=Paenibacillus koleovorans TaxID=121608 RepID=UPI0013E37BE6|nr:Wzz/FepE/Etk N-terminal domain-containing protein [Paenibacillus koleovorans]